MQAMNVVVLFLIVADLKNTQAEEFHGRHVCNQQQTVTQSVPVQQTYRRAVHKKDQPGVTYQTAYRTVFRMQIHAELVPGCCPGWVKRSPRDSNCLKPVCTSECENGGQCVGPDLCICSEGYTGYKCHIDIDECSGRNACQQKCTNLPGSYECACQDGFQLASDEYSCQLCLNCSRDFQNLQTRIQRVQDQSIQNETIQEIKRQIDSLTNVKAKVETISEIQKQIEILKDTTLQDNKHKKIQTHVDFLQNKIKQVDLIKPLVDKLNKLEKSSVNEDRLFQIRSKIENLEELKSDIDAIKVKNEEIQRFQMDDVHGKKIASLQHQIEGFIVGKDEQDRRLAGRLDVMRIELEYVAEMKEKMNALKEMKNQVDEMAVRISELESDKAALKSNLTAAMTQYEAAASAFRAKEVNVQHTVTPDPYETDRHMPMDRLASLSAQISILEEKMADCACNQDYSRG